MTTTQRHQFRRCPEQNYTPTPIDCFALLHICVFSSHRSTFLIYDRSSSLPRLKAYSSEFLLRFGKKSRASKRSQSSIRLFSPKLRTPRSSSSFIERICPTSVILLRLRLL